MKRPILVAIVGYIIGIILGLYFEFSIVLLYICLFLLFMLKRLIIFIKKNKSFFNVKKVKKRKFSIYSISRYFRYIKLVLNRKVVITIIIFSIISNTIVLTKNQKYNNLYKDIETIELIGEIQELSSETEYKKTYKIKVKQVIGLSEANGTYLYLKVDKKSKLNYGDRLKVKGKLNLPDIARNYGGFNYKEYLKTQNIYGTVNASNIEKINESNLKNMQNLRERKRQILNKNLFDKLNKYIHETKEKIKLNAQKNLNTEIYPIYLGLILGDTSQIDKDVKEQFRDSNMSHILAVSGMHISYIILGITVILGKTLGKKRAKIIAIFILIIYVLITGFSPSILRASLMGIMVLLSGLLHRKNDTWTSIAISLFLILIYNPYLISSISLQYTYAGTIGIILFDKNILKFLNKGKENKSKIKEIIAISISAQIFIIPLTLFHFNTFGFYFLLTNVLLSIIIGPIVIIGFFFLILLFLNVELAKFIAIIMNFLIKLIILISNISFLPMSKIYVRTPKCFEIIIYCLIIIFFNFIYSMTHKTNPNVFNLRTKYMLQVVKYKFKENKKRVVLKIQGKITGKKHTKRSFKKFLLLVIIVILIFENMFWTSSQMNLRIHFVDVGQGDCCFIETPNNKTILIDGGGSEFGSFDVGKSTLLPYILDRGYTSVDYIFISHFDSDHVRAEFYLLWKNLK